MLTLMLCLFRNKTNKTVVIHGIYLTKTNTINVAGAPLTWRECGINRKGRSRTESREWDDGRRSI